ncbi:hypothetical protein ARHIZOSPH14_03020 [Agromyces rhizosphaerae]|uniref:Protein-glutamine gamma-glutamyltransferase-like C-terminal domain-containing protein n=1 Tax=Agromyces rhizosphaerae TaxID=88374 RepID=A0A9W6CUR9_9MICO|nr:DUF4129 domain-containing protein [Agromyces rhizosphaerae]GLI26060.1 hypothetical protein ARHIZOSPH14_03020 [Agromyces rhizosphaerae]
MRLDVPLDPDADEARRLLEEELRSPEYAAASPTAFDRAADAVRQWLADLFTGGAGLPAPTLLLIGAVVAAGIVVALLLVYGVPRLRRRTSSSGAALLGDDDLRSAARLRRAAAAAAAAGDWDTAVVEAYRGLARGLDERTVLTLLPGTTAHGVADGAAPAFPSLSRRLADAADDFERVRYGGGHSDGAAYARVRDLDAELARTTPAGLAEPAGAAT